MDRIASSGSLWCRSPSSWVAAESLPRMAVITRFAMLAPFRVRSFRFQFPADLATSWGIEMENLVLGWYILVETGSVLALTLFWALLYLGTLLAPVFGMVGDRIGHRTVLCAMRGAYAVLGVVVTVLAFAGALHPAYVFVIGTLSGLIRPSDQGLRNALVAATMPRDTLMATMGVSRTTSDSARIFGALSGAGLFAAFGLGPVYLAIAGSYLTGFLLTLGVSSGRPLSRPGRRRGAVAVARSARGAGLCLGHAGVAGRPVARLSRQSDGVSADQRPLALCRQGRLPDRRDRPRHAGREFRARLVPRLDRGQHDGPHAAPGPHDDRVRPGLVRRAAGLRPDARPRDRPRRPGRRRDLAGAEPRADVGTAAAQRRRAVSRPGDGGADAGDLRRADRPA